MKIRAFNKNKKLRQLKRKHHGDLVVRRRTMALSVFILVLSIVYFTYASFSEQKDFEIVNATVSDYSGDIRILSYRYDDGSGVMGDHDTPPNYLTGYNATSVSCKNATGKWDKLNWKLDLEDITGSVRCRVTFYHNPVYKEDILGDKPELYDGLVPIVIDEDGPSKGTIKVANPTDSSWYSYAEHRWANAALVKGSAKGKMPGDILSEDEIIQMYVWIPRFRYKLWNAENGSSNPQMIEIAFESINSIKQSGHSNEEWLTHPAFTFGTTELAGFWMGKFETGYDGATTAAEAQVISNDVSKAIIKPNVSSWTYNSLGNMVEISRGLEEYRAFDLISSEVDTHVAKNMEWGAVAYLSHSIYGRYIDEENCISSGCKVWINPNSSRLTGYSGSMESSEPTATGYAWNDQTYGGNSSTTGNLSGIFDMSGCAWEYTMTSTSKDYNKFNSGRSGITSLEDKYYDSYVNLENDVYAHKYGKLGDATKEILSSFGTNVSQGGWYNSYSNLAIEGQFVIRGGSYDKGANASPFYFSQYTGIASESGSWRIVLTAE